MTHVSAEEEDEKKGGEWHTVLGEPRCGVSARLHTESGFDLPSAKVRLLGLGLDSRSLGVDPTDGEAVTSSMRAHRRPIHWILLQDVSGSVTSFLPQLQATLAAFFTAEHAPKDLITLATFNTTTRPNLEHVNAAALTDARVREIVDNLVPMGGTDILKALAWGHKAAAATPTGVQPHLVLISDGEQQHPQLPLGVPVETVLRAALPSGALGSVPIAQILIGNVNECFFAALMQCVTGASTHCSTTALESIVGELASVLNYHESLLLHTFRPRDVPTGVEVKLCHPHVAVQFGSGVAHHLIGCLVASECGKEATSRIDLCATTATGHEVTWTMTLDRVMAEAVTAPSLEECEWLVGADALIHNLTPTVRAELLDAVKRRLRAIEVETPTLRRRVQQASLSLMAPPLLSTLGAVSRSRSTSAAPPTTVAQRHASASAVKRAKSFTKPPPLSLLDDDDDDDDDDNDTTARGGAPALNPTGLLPPALIRQRCEVEDWKNVIASP